MLGIGIDTGGTCTDAVIYDLDCEKILATAKSSTTHGCLEKGIGESLKKLPKELIEKSSYLSLSTTLATNACVENKGGRICLVFIGVQRKILEETYSDYGFESLDFMRFLEAAPDKGVEPDWNEFEAMLPEIFEHYDGIAISQIYARDNGGEYEKKAKEIILKKKEIIVICAYEIFKDLNVIKRGAGALLNARLIPVIRDFFRAIHKVMEDMEMHFPVLIMRSDGSLVSEEYSMKYPVETLLCGPTASIKGAARLMGEDNAIVIDMGGTTSDVALIENGSPIIDEEGVSVAGWKTFVRGIDLDTFGLGGDTHITYNKGELILKDRRVMPVSFLVKNYPLTLSEFKTHSERIHGANKAMYEHFILIKNIDNIRDRYDVYEQKICDKLSEGPLSICELAEKMGRDIYTLHTERLEDEGVILRSGFTPTDAMVVKGDFDIEDEDAKKAAEYVVTFLSRSIERPEEFILEEAYRMVKERMYVQSARILWEKTMKKAPDKEKVKFFTELAAYSFNEGWESKKIQKTRFFKSLISTDGVFLGVGAPIHVFLPDVAGLFGCKYRLSEYSGVTNALGALLGEVSATESIHIRISYDSEMGQGESYNVYAHKIFEFETYEDALEVAVNTAVYNAKKKAMECGAKSIKSIETKEKRQEGRTDSGTLFMGSEVVAICRGSFWN